MAEASTPRFNIEDLTQCGICLLELQQPKALPCLHSFCLKCLSQWAKGKSSVTCPLCVQEFQIPSGGVNSFRTNFFINTLKERSENLRTIKLTDAVRPCANCELSETKIKGHCDGCKGFICKDCVSIHAKIKNLRDHKIISYADLQSGKINIKDIYEKKQCKIHEYQVLKFYCETCGELICLECTVIDHPATIHSLLNLESATKVQKTEIEQLTKSCDDVRKKIDGSLEELDVISDMLAKNMTKAGEDIEKAFQNTVKIVENERNKLRDALKKVGAERKKQISAEKDMIQLEQTRLVTALQMATKVLQTGSDYDLAQVYSFLKTNLTTLCNLKPRRNHGKIFSELSVKAASTSQHVVYDLGSISSGRRDRSKRVGAWKMYKSFGDTGDRKMGLGRDVAITQQSDIVVADSVNSSIKCYEANGRFKSSTSVGGPQGIKTSHDGRVFITTGKNHVKVYNKNMNFQYEFPVVLPDIVLSETGSKNSSLFGLAFDNHMNLLVGETSKKYISKHRLDGTHVSGFKVSITPFFISVSSQDKVVVSSYNDKAVHILDEQGNPLHRVKHPPELSLWIPNGVCCSSDEEVYIANWARPGSIHVYSIESGDYIRCIVKGLTNPIGLALMDNDEKLVVVHYKGGTIYQLE